MAKSVHYQEKLALIAQDYYLSQLTITEISDKYQLSRYLIKKYLDEALSSGLVTVQINSPVSRNLELELRFKKLFHIAHIYIVTNTSTPNDEEEKIVEYAAEQLQTLIHDSHVVGLAWGGTVYDVIANFQPEIREDLIFTQFMGENMKYHSSAGSRRLVEQAAQKFSTHYQTMVGPLYITQASLREALKQEPALRPTLAYTQRMDLIFMGLGTLASIDSIPTWKQNRSAIFPGVNPQDIAGILYGRPYDIQGHILNTKDDTVFGADLATIMAVPRRFAIVKSKFKTRATLGALRGGFLTDLVIDEAIANRILMELETEHADIG